MEYNKKFLPITDEEFSSLDISFLQEDVLTKEKIDEIAKGVAVDAFRNGIVEDMHSKGQLSNDDMKALNKYMVDRIARTLTLIKNGEWNKLFAEIKLNSMYASDWDEANPNREAHRTPH